MLKSVEILIGLSVIMLVLSMVITLLTQFVTSVVNSRGRHLKNALADLLTQIEPRLEPIAEGIARTILTHPVIRETTVFGQLRMGSVIQREEFTKIILELASGKGPQGRQYFQAALEEVLKNHGIADPERTLEQTRMLALQLEASNPQLANSARQNMALLQEAASSFTGKVNGWFDQMMDRSSARFTFTTRGITFACAAVLAVALQVDTIGIVNRLGTDDQLRAELNQLATRVMDTESANTTFKDLSHDAEFAASSADAKRERVRTRIPSLAKLSDAELDAEIKRQTSRALVKDPGFAASDQQEQRKRLIALRPDLANAPENELDEAIKEYARPALPAAEKEYLTTLAERDLVTLPRWGTWWRTFEQKSLLGIIVSAFLLSLGAPFWYSALKQLINLRSVLARKEDEQRDARQKSQDTPAQAAAAGTALPAATLTGGERGDLGALG